MRALSAIKSTRLLLGSVSLLTLCSLAQAQTHEFVETNDYIYIGIEAEDHVGKDERWVLTDPSTPTMENDPDGNHSDGAGNSQNLELLPDIRVTHDDEFGPPTAYWGQGGQGPYADYTVNFTESGRYYVHVRAYSTGTEDNGIHIGINGTWPQSGQRMQFCSASKRSWWWSSAQRDAGGNGSCGIEKSIWLDVPSAGTHTVSISAREDGFEIDRLALIKDKSDNTRVCSPVNLNSVNCVNGSIESADEFVDLRVRLYGEPEGADPEVEQPNPVEVVQGSNLILSAKIENLDAFDTAEEIVFTLSPGANDWQITDMDSRCEESSEVINCTLSSLHPTAPNEYAEFLFTMLALQDGDLRIDGAVTSVDMDEAPDNDIAATVIRVLPGTVPDIEETDLVLSMDTDAGEYTTGDVITLSIDINNAGAHQANNIVYTLTVPDELGLIESSLPSACVAGATIECSFASLPANASESFSLAFEATTQGVHTVNGSLVADNEANSANNIDADSLLVSDPVVEPPVDNTDDGSETTGSTDSATAGNTAGATAGQTDEGVSTEGANTDGGTTAGTGNSSGSADGDGSDGQSTSGQSDEASDAGSVSLWLFCLMLLVFACRFSSVSGKLSSGNWFKQRQLIVVRKQG